MSLDVARDPETPAARLLALAREASPEATALALALAENPSCPPEALALLCAGERAPAVWAALARHPALPVPQLFVAGRQAPSSFWSNPALPLLALEDPNFYTLLARHSPVLLCADQAPHEALWAGARAKDLPARQALARNRCAPPALLSFLALEVNDSVTLGLLAEHPGAPEEALRAVYRKRERRAFLGLAKNPVCPVDLMTSLAEHDDVEVRAGVAVNPSFPAKARAWLVRLGSAPTLRTLGEADPTVPAEELGAAARRGPWAQVLAALHPAAPRALVLSLARNGIPYVRREIGRHLASEVLVEALASSADEPCLIGLAQNPRAPAAVLDRLLGDSRASIVGLVAAHPGLSEAQLRRLVVHPNAAVRYALARRAGLAVPLQERLLVSRQQDIRRSLAERVDLAPHLRERLCWDLVEGVRRPALLASPQAAAHRELMARGEAAGARAPGGPVPLTPALREALLAAGHYGWQLLVQDAQTPPAVLGEIVRRVMLYREEGPAIEGDAEALLLGPLLNLLALDPRLPAEALDALARIKNQTFRESLLKHPALTATTLSLLAEGAAPPLAQRLARHPAAEAALLLRLAEQHSGEVRLLASQHPSFPAAQRALWIRAGAAPDLSHGEAEPDPLLSGEVLRALAAGGAFSRFLAAGHPNTPPEVLGRLAADPSIPLARWATNPSTPAVLLLQIAHSLSGELRRVAAENPRLPPEARALLERAGADASLCHPTSQRAALSAEDRATLLAGGPFARVLLARSQGLPEAEQRALAEDPSFQVRAALAGAPGLLRAVAVRLASDHSREVRAALAKNHAVPWEVVAALLEGEPADERCLCGLAGRPQLPGEARAALFRAKGKTLHALAGRADLTLAEQRALLAVQDGGVVRAIVAANPGCAVSLLEELAVPSLFLPDPGLARALGENPSLPLAQLMILAGSQSRSAERALLARPSLPEEVLLLLAQSHSRRTSAEAKHRLA